MSLRRSIPILVGCLLAVGARTAQAAGGGADELMRISPLEVVTAIVVFLVLLFFLTKVAWKPILGGLQKREETIQKAVDDAQRASEEARALVEQYEQKLATASDEARAIADEARRDAEDVRRRIEEDARRQAETTLARAVREVQQAKDKAYEELLRDVAAIAAETATRMVRRTVTPEEHADLVDEVVRDYAAQRQGSGGA